MDRAEGLLRAREGTATKRAATVMVEEVKFGYIYIYLESICIDRERERGEQKVTGLTLYCTLFKDSI